MGLDSYFTARQYLSDWNEEDKELKTKVSALAEGIATEWEVKEVVYEVGYWRKANAIHNWFVQNVQDNVDDCKEHYVSKDNIIKLYDAVCQVLEDQNKVGDLLPPQRGFFFGGTEIDEYYFEVLKHTKEILQPIINIIRNSESEPKELYKYDFYYRSSW